MYFVHKKPIKQLSVCFGILFVGKGLQVWRLRSLFLLLLLYHTDFFLIEEGVEEIKNLIRRLQRPANRRKNYF